MYGAAAMAPSTRHGTSAAVLGATTILLFLVALQLLAFHAAGREVVVGGTTMWSPSSNLDEWTKNTRLEEGDVVIFKWNATTPDEMEVHDLVQVLDLDRFDHCDPDEAAEIAPPDVRNPGVRVNVTKQPQYFMCSTHYHCPPERVVIQAYNAAAVGSPARTSTGPQEEDGNGTVPSLRSRNSGFLSSDAVSLASLYPNQLHSFTHLMGTRWITVVVLAFLAAYPE
ncbi:hypothetical protein CBR_g21062 [Chara braunii]|uniref:Phytocyanin domain-containing protein n=1 Tax=Chara braunii TaxID=69332 RepID=A0A388L0I8_CHABU|nr:hypothetical protein CBR_g21062 [Chara braunii]|eukprot:GBG75817.1 hypothetical protein CBR_g21062 [Chara braunii]